jgi:hypothetical protein
MNLSQKALKFIIILAFGALKYCVKSYRERLNFHCDLIDSGCAYEVTFKPFIANPLTVATNKSGNMRFILDLSVLNKFG